MVQSSVARCPSCRQTVLKTSTGTHPFFSHQQAPEGRDIVGGWRKDELFSQHIHIIASGQRRYCRKSHLITEHVTQSVTVHSSFFNHCSFITADGHQLTPPGRLQTCTFKLCVTIYWCLHGLAARHLTHLCRSLSEAKGRHHPRTAARGLLYVPRYEVCTDNLRKMHLCLRWSSYPKLSTRTSADISSHSQQLQVWYSRV